MQPPKDQTDLDDGYLSASEVTAVKLDADWVIRPHEVRSAPRLSLPAPSSTPMPERSDAARKHRERQSRPRPSGK